LARPRKSGVDYWPFDVGLLEDKKFKLIKGEFGIKGVFIALLLLNEIYRTDGYFKAWDDDDCLLMSEGVGCGCAPTLVSEVLHRCCERSLFDKRVFDVFGVITSAGIQRRYLRIVANNRDSIPIIQEYWLLDINDENDVPASTLNKLTFISKDRKENPVIRKENPINRKDNATKKRKSNKSKEDDESPRACVHDDSGGDRILNAVEDRVLKRAVSSFEREQFRELYKRHGYHQMLQAVNRTVSAGGRSMEYIQRVLQSNSGNFVSGSSMYAATYDHAEIEKLLDDDFFSE